MFVQLSPKGDKLYVYKKRAQSRSHLSFLIQITSAFAVQRKALGDMHVYKCENWSI